MSDENLVGPSRDLVEAEYNAWAITLKVVHTSMASRREGFYAGFRRAWQARSSVPEDTPTDAEERDREFLGLVDLLDAAGSSYLPEPGGVVERLLDEGFIALSTPRGFYLTDAGRDVLAAGKESDR